MSYWEESISKQRVQPSNPYIVTVLLSTSFNKLPWAAGSIPSNFSKWSSVSGCSSSGLAKMSSSKRSLLKKMVCNIRGYRAISFSNKIKSTAKIFHILSSMSKLVFQKILNLGFLSWNYEDYFSFSKKIFKNWCRFWSTF